MSLRMPREKNKCTQPTYPKKTLREKKVITNSYLIAQNFISYFREIGPNLVTEIENLLLILKII